jgi:hypothetical protein
VTSSASKTLLALVDDILNVGSVNIDENVLRIGGSSIDGNALLTALASATRNGASTISGSLTITAAYTDAFQGASNIVCFSSVTASAVEKLLSGSAIGGVVSMSVDETVVRNAEVDIISGVCTMTSDSTVIIPLVEFEDFEGTFVGVPNSQVPTGWNLVTQGPNIDLTKSSFNYYEQSNSQLVQNPNPPFTSGPTSDYTFSMVKSFDLTDIDLLTIRCVQIFGGTGTVQIFLSAGAESTNAFIPIAPSEVAPSPEEDWTEISLDVSSLTGTQTCSIQGLVDDDAGVFIDYLTGELTPNPVGPSTP